MSVLVFGASGQLGCALRQHSRAHEVSFFDREHADLTRSEAIAQIITSRRPSVVINAAAYTAVDRAETDRETAFAVNATAPQAMAQASALVGARFIHVSTDYVFDGRSCTPYLPNDVPRPINAYGESKLAGEQAVIATPRLNYLILRTSWVYSSTGRNFALTMLKLGRDRKIVRVVADQVGSPTSAPSLAECVWAAANSNARGILHFTDAGVASWYDFACAIFEEAGKLNLLHDAVTVEPIATGDFPTPSKRPSFSVLDKAATYSALKIAPVHWRVRLREVLNTIQRDSA